MTATLKQLENQKGEAQKRLDDLKAQVIKKFIFKSILWSIQKNTWNFQVNKIREQCQKQEATLKEQETELDARRSELQKLKDEEAQLEKEYDTGLKELEKLSRNLQDTQLQINQVRSMVTQLEEIKRQMNDALAMCRNAIDANDAILVSDYSLKIEPEFREFKEALHEKKKGEAAPDPFSEGGAKVEGNLKLLQIKNFFIFLIFLVNGFKTSFGDPFTKPTGFDDSFDNQNAFGESGFSADPFGDSSADPFGDKSAAAAPKEVSKLFFHLQFFVTNLFKFFRPGKMILVAIHLQFCTLPQMPLKH